MKPLRTSAITDMRMIRLLPTTSNRQFHSWRTSQARVYTGLYMGASNNARLHWIIHLSSRERVGHFSLVPVFASVSRSLSVERPPLPTWSSSFSSHSQGRGFLYSTTSRPLPPPSLSLFFLSCLRTDRHSTKKRRMKKSRAPWPLVTRPCLAVARGSVAELRILFKGSRQTGYSSEMIHVETNRINDIFPWRFPNWEIVADMRRAQFCIPLAGISDPANFLTRKFIHPCTAMRAIFSSPRRWGFACNLKLQIPCERRAKVDPIRDSPCNRWFAITREARVCCTARWAALTIAAARRRRCNCSSSQPRIVSSLTWSRRWAMMHGYFARASNMVHVRALSRALRTDTRLSVPEAGAGLRSERTITSQDKRQ